MESFILVDGDTVLFMPTFAPAIVIVQPGRMMGTGAASPAELIQGRKPCVEGDERLVQVPGCTYTSGPHTIPGIGTLKIERLNPDQIAQNTRFGGRRALLIGTMFMAVFEVQSPARMVNPPAPPIPDPVPMYRGQGRFQTANVTRKGS